MKVLFLSQIVPYPPHGGVLQRGFNVLRELGRRAEVHLLAFVHPDALPTPATLAGSREVLGEFCSSVEYFSLWPKRSKAHTATALAMGLLSRQPFSVIAHRSIPFGRSARHALATGTFDIVHADTIALTPFVDLLWSRPAPTVLTHHNIESQLMQRRAEVEGRAAARWFLSREASKLRDFEAAVSPRYDVNVFMSEPDRNLLMARVPDLRAAVVPNGVDVDYFAPDDSGGSEAALIYAGGMNMFANRDAVMYFLAEVWPAVTAAVPHVKFYAVGMDPPRELTALAEQDPRIVVTGYVDDIRPFVRKAAVYVVPLRVGGGTRLKVLDAMASGKAIVSTAVGCEGIDVVPDQHLLVAENPGAFARATVGLLGDLPQRLRLGAAARARVHERYAWSVVGEHLMDAYRQAIAHHATR